MSRSCCDSMTLAIGVRTGAPPAAPKILSQNYEWQTRQAIVFQFDQNVSAFLSRKDYRIINKTTGQTLLQSAGTLSFNQSSIRQRCC